MFGNPQTDTIASRWFCRSLDIGCQDLARKRKPALMSSEFNLVVSYRAKDWVQRDPSCQWAGVGCKKHVETRPWPFKGRPRGGCLNKSVFKFELVFVAQLLFLEQRAPPLKFV